jgi:hypothetical protein
VYKLCREWEGENLNDPTECCGALRLRSLGDFLSADNYVEVIRNYFLQSLDELENLIEEFSSSKLNDLLIYQENGILECFLNIFPPAVPQGT